MNRAFRGRVLHFLGEPGDGASPANVAYHDDGMLVVRDGRIVEAGDAATLSAGLPAGTMVVDHSGKLLLPGFVDAHVHYPQTDVIASYGEQLLEWLEKYTFPTERRFADPEHARATAEFFLDEMLRNGTTTALVLGTVHPQSVDALFAAAQARRMRLAAGKVMMDRNCPEWLCDTAASGAAESRALIERWHGRDRLLYALTPRFAPTSTEEQLLAIGELAAEFPDTFVHTHLAENRDEVNWVAELFPWSRSYLEVYEHFGLLRPRSVFAHCIHLDDRDRALMAERGGVAAFCPSANLFLGSGLFDLRRAREAGVRIAIGTDVGAGTSFSILRTLADAYKVAQMERHRLSPWRAFWLGTLGSAQALGLDDRIGNFLRGKEADFVVLDLEATPLLARRTRLADGDLAAQLFALLMLGDDRCVAATYVLGDNLHPGSASPPAGIRPAVAAPTAAR